MVRVCLRCAVPTCRHNSGDPKVSKLRATAMFSIPKDERRKVWLQLMKPINPKAPNLLICQEHFAEGDIAINRKRKRVIWGAVPTLNLPRSDDEESTATPVENTSIDEDMQLDEVKSEPDDGVMVDLFTEEETVVQEVQKRALDTEESETDLSEIPVKKERTEDMYEGEEGREIQPCEIPVKKERTEDKYEGEEGQEMQPSYRYDSSFPRPLKSQNELENTNEKEFEPLKSNETELDLFIKLSKAYLSPELAKFIEVQALLKSKLKAAFKRKQYSTDVSVFALKLYHKYPQTYKFVQESFCLPTILKIRLLCRNLSFEMNDNWMTILRARFQYASAVERECVVCVAKTRLSLGLSYDPARDCMTGLSEMDGVQRPHTARYAIVVYARGIMSRWRQPLSYALLPASYLLEEVWRWLDDMFSKLFDIGLNVRAIVTDFDDEYNPIIRVLAPTKTYFQLKDKQIYYFYDCTKLMVKLRDSFRKYNVNFKGMVAEWNVIEELFAYDSSRRYKLGAGLTAEHIKHSPLAARKTKLAIETLSPKVGSALAAAVDIRVLDDSAHGTVEFTTKFGNLYDILHNKELRVLAKGIPPELRFLHEMLVDFKRISFVEKGDIGSVPDSGLIISAFSTDVRTAMALHERMRHSGYNALPLRAFNNDPLHELFDRARVLNGNKDPTGRQLIDSFRKSFVVNIMKSFSKEGKLNGFLETASGITDITMQVERPAFKGLVKASHIEPLTRLTMRSHILLAQCLRLKPCCELGAQFCLKPPAVFSEYLSNMEYKFRYYFAPEKLAEGLMASILASVDQAQFPAPCRCFPLHFLHALYLRFRIDNLTTYNNTKLRQGISRDFTMNTNINSY